MAATAPVMIHLRTAWTWGVAMIYAIDCVCVFEREMWKERCQAVVYGAKWYEREKVLSSGGRAPVAKAFSPRASRVPPQLCLTTNTKACLHNNTHYASSLEILYGRYRKRTNILTMSHNSRPSTSRISSVPSQKPRQLSHLQAQLAQLTANMADLESLMRMTAGQAQDMRALGGYSGAM